MLTLLVEKEIHRIKKRSGRKDYNRGRVAGYEDSIGLLKTMHGIPDSEDFVGMRGVFREKLREAPRVTLFDSGWYKSFRNVYSSLYVYAYDPTGVFPPVSGKQLKLIGILSDKGAPEFYGLTSVEACNYIDKYQEETL